MRIACPSCAAVYEVPDAALAASTELRCARCGHQWVPAPEFLPQAVRAPYPEADAADTHIDADVALAPEPATDLPPAEAEDHPPAPRVPPRRAPRPLAPPPVEEPLTKPGPAVVVAWALSILIVLGVIVGGVVLRDRVMSVWPPSARLYTALGLTHPAH